MVRPPAKLCSWSGCSSPLSLPAQAKVRGRDITVQLWHILTDFSLHRSTGPLSADWEKFVTELLEIGDRISVALLSHGQALPHTAQVRHT